MAQCKAITATGVRCSRKISKRYRSYCKQHGDARNRKNKAVSRKKKRQKGEGKKKLRARKAKKLELSQQEGCGNPNCMNCAPPPKKIIGFAQDRDEKIIELCQTTNMPLWKIARIANVDEKHVIELCQTLGLEREDTQIGSPETWTPLFRSRYSPRRLRRLRRYRRR